MKEKHYFAGNNTYKGFYSFFNFIISPEEANHIYILKGGPGVGKSSFMKKFASIFEAKGYDIEYIHCSSDNSSLDGILIPSLKIAIMDGTAPHNIEPKFPGIIDEIVNLGHFIDSTKLLAHKKEIIDTNKVKSSVYKSAYRYLECANIVLEEIYSIYDRATDDLKFSEITKNVVDGIFNTPSNFANATKAANVSDKNISKQGCIRKLFSEAITADGYVSFTDSLCEGKRVWMITGQNMNYITKLLERLVSESLKKGYSIEGFYRPLNPDKLQHVLINDLNLMIRSNESDIEISNEIDNENNNKKTYNIEKIIDFNDLIDTEVLNSSKLSMENNHKLYDIMLHNAYSKLQDTKKYHSFLEQFYVDSMNFKGVDEWFDKLLSTFNL